MAEEQGQIVVVSAPDDGLESVSVLLSALPHDISVPVVLVLRGASQSIDDLAKHTALAVEPLSSGEVPLRPGVIYVAPDEHRVKILNGAAVVQSRRTKSDSVGQRLIHSAAEAYGERLVAVFLRGLPPEAAHGIYEVSERGGTVIAQGRGGYGGLPSWLPPTKVDIVAPLEEIGRVTHDLLRGEDYLQQLDDEEAFRVLLEELREQFGIDFSTYKRPTIKRRLQRRMAETGQTSVSNYVGYLQSHADEAQRLVSSFLIKVTQFFRDPQLFEYLRDHILPELIEEARRGDKEIRLWSAGCATGEEAYSLAILIADLLGPELDDFRVRIFATDLDEDAIEFARHGTYPPAAVAGLPPEMVERHFIVDGEFQVKKRVRSLCIFGVHDLGDRAPFPRIDVLVCRNVLIYFTTEAQRRVLQLFAFSLRAGGYLVLGKSETPSPLSEYFADDNGRLKVYRRRDDQMLIPPARIRETTPSLTLRHTAGHPQADRELPRVPRDIRLPVVDGRAEDIIHRLPVGILTVDAHYDIRTLNGAARRMLNLHGTAVGEDFIHQVQDVPTRELRAAVDRALRGTESTLHDVPVVEPATGTTRYLRMLVAPDGRADESAGQGVTVLVTDITDEAEERRGLQRDLEEQRELTTQLESQLERLTTANQDLLAANQELTVQNMELSSANEEFLVGNEELQAAAEEVETLNEELQATNEELETLNEELQATVEELNTTNEDLQARSVELQELAVSLESQRAAIEIEQGRLEAILASIADGVLVVDADGIPSLTNGAYDAIFPPGAQPDLVDGAGQPIPANETPQVRVTRGETFSMEFCLSEPHGGQRWFEANGCPVQGPKAGGGVVVIRDISDRRLQRS